MALSPPFGHLQVRREATLFASSLKCRFYGFRSVTVAKDFGLFSLPGSRFSLIGNYHAAHGPNRKGFSVTTSSFFLFDDGSGNS